MTTYYHNIEWANQPNNYYCGPTSAFMVLRSVGAWYSTSGAPPSIYNVAQYMHTDAYGYTSFHDRWLSRGMNDWLGRNVYTSVHTPSYETVRDAFVNSYRNGYATVLDERERCGCPHFNGHNNGTFAYLMVVDGYEQGSNTVYIADPGAPTLWPSGSANFWYPSLRDFLPRPKCRTRSTAHVSASAFTTPSRSGRCSRPPEERRCLARPRWRSLPLPGFPAAQTLTTTPPSRPQPGLAGGNVFGRRARLFSPDGRPGVRCAYGPLGKRHERRGL